MILIIEDEAVQRETLMGFLRKRGHEVEGVASGPEGLARLRERPVDLILTDYRMPEMSGLEVLRTAKEINPEVAVVVITAYGTVENAVEAMKKGAWDFIAKPIDLDELELMVKRALERQALISENRALREQLRTRYQFEEIISSGSEMEEALNLAGRAASSKATVLIRGESGTGKELIARAIHYASPRKDRPFVAVSCAALSGSLLESELFGHEKGSFTGADRMRRGRFEQADGGTLFIDEIGDIPLAVQVKLLRVLQEQAFERVGGNETLHVDVRIIAATHRDLERIIREGTFREDLFYRLNVVCIEIPQLRRRRSDIPLLVEHFLRAYAEENAKTIEGVSKEAMDRLMKYDYPGNVRELENAIERAVVLTRGRWITREDLPLSIRGAESEQDLARIRRPGSLPERIEQLERQAIADALEQAGGVQSRAAAELAITERNLRYKLRKYGMKSSRGSGAPSGRQASQGRPTRRKAEGIMDVPS